MKSLHIPSQFSIIRFQMLETQNDFRADTKPNVLKSSSSTGGCTTPTWRGVGEFI